MSRRERTEISRPLSGFFAPSSGAIFQNGSSMGEEHERSVLYSAALVGLICVGASQANENHDPEKQTGDARVLVFDGVLHDGAMAPEVSTSELRTALSNGTAAILDARPLEEYAVSHIPGARAVPGKPGSTGALYVADTQWVVDNFPNKSQPLILYCNGLNCGRSKRFSEDLGKAGYSHVRRYQLGAPAWRALGGVMQVEKSALIRLLGQDATAVLIDAREQRGAAPKLRNATQIALKDAAKAKDDGRLPMTDHNTRIFVVGENEAQARQVAEAIVHDAFHNVAFFAGSVADVGELHVR